MIGDLARLAQPLLLALDPEVAHGVALRALKAGLVPRSGPDDPRLGVSVLGLDFPNPFGTAAGFDKNAEATDAALEAGFGFVEVGAVTPRPQSGNPRPRMFRLIAERAVINRLGFNNEGLEAVRQRLAHRRRGGIVGVNLGANRDSADKGADMQALIEALAPHADYFTVNVSSPNTPGLRDLQRREALEELLERVLGTRDRLAGAGPRRPVLVKIAPDLDEAGFADIVDAVRAMRPDGLVVSNTTVSRKGLRNARLARESGGLSGRPLFRPSTRLLARARLALGPGFPLIGVGGIDSGEAAWAKIKAGADLVQLYTGLIYEGVGLLSEMKQFVLERLDAEGHGSLAQAVGTDAERWVAWTA